jgi:D-alanyl-D-alanine carboxypeptidase/D-alanyl-D-alanine-endopeptidase (penicillin-binding protein 4)
MRRFYPVIALSLLVSSGCFGTACAARSPASTTTRTGVVDSPERLRADLDRTFSDRNFGTAQWGVEIVSLERGEVLYEHNAAQLCMPASNNKLLTAAAALVRLGPDFRFETRVLAAGDVSDGALLGDLVIVGSGDPTFAPRFLAEDPLKTFKEWASRLKQTGIVRIEGKLVGDEGAFADSGPGRGWAWDDLGYGYAAPVSGLQFHDNVISLELKPGSEPGSDAAIAVLPFADYVRVDSAVVTGKSGGEAETRIERLGTGESARISGSIPLNSRPVRRTVAVRSPAQYYLRALRHALEAEGIRVSGEDQVVRNANVSAFRPLWTHLSPPLSEILKPLLKISQNLYAETLARALGVAAQKSGSFADGRQVVQQVLRGMAIEPGTYSYADGSGLSRLNLVSADILVRLLKFMQRHRYAEHFLDALPVAGVDGTLEERMKGTRAEKNVRAKTGSIAHVRSLAGYVRTADGELLAFAMIANNFLVSTRAAEYVQDSALERLASFTR